MMEFVRNMKKKVKQGFGRLYQNKPLFYKSILFCFFFLLSLISTFLLPYAIYKDVDIKHIQEVFHEKEAYAEKVLEDFRTRIVAKDKKAIEYREGIYEDSKKNEITFQVYWGDELVYWTDNSLTISDNSAFPSQKKFFYNADNASVVVIQSFCREYRCVALIKIKDRILSSDNDERNHFAKQFGIPGSVMVSKSTGGEFAPYTIKDKEGRGLFSLKNTHYKTKSRVSVIILSLLWGMTLLSALTLILDRFLSWKNRRNERFVGWSRKWRDFRNAWLDPDAGGGRFRWQKIFFSKIFTSLLLLLFVLLVCDVGIDPRVNVAVPFIQDISGNTILALLLVFVLSYLYYVVLNIVRKLYASKSNVKKIWVVQILISGSVMLYFLSQSLWVELILFFFGTVIILFVDLYKLYYEYNLFLYTAPIAFTFANLIVWTTFHYSEKKNEREYQRMAYEIGKKNCVYQDDFAEELLKAWSRVLVADSSIAKMVSEPKVNETELLDYINFNYVEYFSGKYDLQLQVCDSLGTLYLRLPNYEEKTFPDLEVLKKDFKKIPNSCFYANKNEKLAVSYLGTLEYNGKKLYLKFYRQSSYDQYSLLEQSLQKSDRTYFSVAKYLDGQRSFSEGEYRYPIYMAWLETSGKYDYVIYANSHTHYVHKFDLGESASVVSVPDRQNFVCMILVTYLFTGYLLVSLVYFFVYSVWKSLLNKKKSIFSQMQLTFLLPTIVEFVILIMFSFPFFKNQMEKNCFSELKEKSLIIQHVVQNFTGGETVFSVVSGELYSEVKRLANQFHLDIVLYDSGGELKFSSRPLFIAMDRRQSNLICPKMKFGNYQDLILKEHVGEVGFYSHYMKAYNLKNEHVGYIQIQSQKAHEKVKSETINLLALVIDAYLFISLISMFIIWLLHKRSTRPLRLLSDRFAEIRLSGRNTLIEYPYQDEFGDLVERYNKMVVQLEESAQKMARSEREFAWREMARRIAHEIKNPLTPMKLSVQQCMRKQVLEPNSFPEYFNKTARLLIEQIDNLANIASEFSSFAKASETKAERLDVIAKLRSSTELFGNNPEEVEFSLHLNGHECEYVWMDEKQMLQVLNNLFRNAIQSIPSERKGRVDVFYKNEDGFACVEVKDNGSGIPEDVQKNVFEPNFTTKTSGMGLGLAIVKNILVAVGGDIRFETTVGEGTSFYFKVPLMEADKA